MNSGGSSNVSLKYERYASSGCWNLGIIKLGFVAKTQFPFARIQIYIEKTKKNELNLKKVPSNISHNSAVVKPES